MASLEGKGPKLVEKLDGVNIHLWKFKMEMVLAKKLWEIVEGSKEPLLSSTDPKLRIAYNWSEQKAFAILALNLSDLQRSHIGSCKTSTMA